MRYGVRRCGVCAGSIRRVNATDMHPVLVVDFGAQYAQLIARRVREANVYSEIVPHTMSVADMLAKEPAAIILSGGPSSVYEEGAPSVDPAIFEAGVPVLGICYGFQTMAHALGGTVGRTGTREYGHTEATVAGESCLFGGTPDDQIVWMSHGDAVQGAPEGFTVTASTTETPVAAFESRERRLYGLQWHPEVGHSQFGQDALKNFLYKGAGLEPTWTAGSIVDEQVEKIREQVGDAQVICALSGGVDSSVAAALLVEQGYDVTGVYMKNWSEDLPGMHCPWAEDVADAKRVAVGLGIDFRVFDFRKEYKQNVVDYMIREYQAGRTPNPDIMCNQEVKFKIFLEASLAAGADYIATGHYARVAHESSSSAKLLRARDDNKDQTYFLYRVTSEALSKTIFPLGDFTKAEVREMAKERGLWTASKKESMGICFVGQVGIREFLLEYIKTAPGNIIDQQTGSVVGKHDGAIFYTLGQRHGLNVGGGLPYYVVGKDMEKNEVYVSRSIDNDNLWRKELRLADIHWINQAPHKDKNVQVRLRHRGALFDAKIDGDIVHLSASERAVAAGQSAVIYDGDECLGGGIVKTD